MSPAAPDVDVLVVGAGISGLAYAWRARRRGERVRVVEEAPRAGGVLRTVRRGDYRVERAATSIPAGARHLGALLETLPGAPALVPAAHARTQFLWTRAGLRPLPRTPRAALGSPLLGPGAMLRIAAEALRGPRPGGPGETLEGFVRRRFGATVARNLLRPFTAGVYGAHPARLGAADAFPRLVALERRRGSVLRGLLALRGGAGGRQVRVVDGGTGRLVDALVAALGADLDLGVRAEALAPGGPWARVRLSTGATVSAAEVVLAIPAGAQARLLAPHLPVEAETLASVPYTPLAVVAVGFRCDRGPRPPEGFGFLRGARTRGRILGATFNSRLAPATAPAGHDLVTVYAGGTEDPGFVDLSDDAAGAVVLADLSRALGGRIVPDLVDVWRWPRAIPLLAPGHRGRMAAVQAAADAHRVRLLGAHVTGVSLEQCVTPRPRPLE